MEKLQKLSMLQDLTEEALYLAGTSFVLGSLVTVFILVVFDWIKYSRGKKTETVAK